MQIIYKLKTKKKYEYIDDYLLQLRSKGRFSFTFEELKNRFNSSEQAIRRKISRLKADNKISIIRKDFYVILLPEYLENGNLPPDLYIDDLMRFLEREYYIALYSSAALYEVPSLQSITYQIIVKKPIRNFRVGNIKFTFFFRKVWNPNCIEKKNSQLGSLNTSVPELTALDFMAFNGKIGGISQIAIVLERLIEKMKPTQMFKVGLTYSQNSALQRLGYIFDKIFNRQDLAKSIKRILAKRKTQNILLSISSTKKGNIDRDWKVDVNIEIEPVCNVLTIYQNIKI